MKNSHPIRNDRILLLPLIIVAGLFLLNPHLDFQTFLSTGDHGRDLYAFEATLKGAKPYRDYWWVYGPLMPYYYSLFYKFFGIKITSVLLGKMCLNLLSGIFFYLTASCVMSPLMACLASLWFWLYQPDFFFTYNHAGGITALLATIYSVFLYLKKPRIRYLYFGLFSLFILSLIKVNFGIFSYLAFGGSILFIDCVHKHFFSSPKRCFWIVFSLLPLLIIFIYLLFVQGLPLYAIRQCLPYLPVDHPYNAPLTQTIEMFYRMIIYNLAFSWPNLIFGAIILFSVGQILFLIQTKKLDISYRNKLLSGVFVLLIFSVLNLHEFLAGGVLYTTFWVKPFHFLLMFLVLDSALRPLHRIVVFLFQATIVLMIFLESLANAQMMQFHKKPVQYLSLERGKIYTTNSSAWIDTVQTTTRSLMSSLKEHETFFALPYDPLYYFLTGKVSPTRQLIFFEHINIPLEQDNEIIRELETKKVNYILISSRANAEERGLGILGETYCPRLGAYIRNQFEVVEVIGDWQNEPGWAWNHGTKILKRKSIQR